MNKPRNGKIARFPSDIRDELNRRMQDGEKSPSLVKWLNSLPVVQEILEDEFGGRPVQKQNISTWRTGGYREWEVREDAMEAIQRVNEDVITLRDEASEELTHNLAFWLATRYATAAQKMEKEGGEMEWKKLREFCSDLVALRRGDLSAERLLVEKKRQMVQEYFCKNRWMKELDQAMEALRHYVYKNHPEAKAALEALAEQVCGKKERVRKEESEP